MALSTTVPLKIPFKSEYMKASYEKGIRELLLASNDPLLLHTELLAKNRTTLLMQLDYYASELEKINPARFPFLTSEQKKRLENELLDTFFLLYSKYQLDTVEGRKKTLADLTKALNLCAARISELNGSPVVGEKATPAAALAAEISLADKSLQLLGLTIIAKWLVDKMYQLSTNYTGTIKEWMTEVNTKRLYWIWGGGMLSSILDMLPENFFNKQQAQKGLDAPTPITGYMSWVLYYARFGINLFLLLKHTLGPWLVESEESKIPMWERFTTQWQQRKFDLLNDSIWATANMVCFFWLYGEGMLGYAGNFVTVGLLIMDLTLATWKYWEKSTQHNAEKLAIENEINELSKQIDAINPEETEQLENLKAQKGNLELLQAKLEFDWKYERYGLINDWIYALSLIMGFCLLCAFFFPPAALLPATAMIIGVIGAAVCFGLTVAYAAISNGIHIAKTKETSHLTHEKYQKYLVTFQAEKNPQTKKELYLEIKRLIAESDYQQRLARFQTVKLVRAVLIDALVPALVFVALVFMPLGIGLALLVAGFALSVSSNILINRFEPELEKLPVLDNEEYEDFEKLKLEKLIPTEKESYFFPTRNESLVRERGNPFPQNQMPPETFAPVKC